jgi:hypothetical protein
MNSEAKEWQLVLEVQTSQVIEYFDLKAFPFHLGVQFFQSSHNYPSDLELTMASFLRYSIKSS